MSSSILRDLREQRRVEDEEIKRERAWEEAHIAEIDREFQISLQQSRQRSKNLSPEYWVSFTPIRGDDVEYGPFAKASEAKEVFEHTFPAFDGGDCCLYKLESHEGISPEELRKGAYQEQCQDDPYGRGYTRIVNKATTVLARDEWESSWDHGEVDWTHAGKNYDESFLKEIQPELTHEQKLQRERQIEADRLMDQEYRKELQERERKRPWEPEEIISESQWIPGFNSECREYLGKDNGGYYYGFESGQGDLNWHGPFDTLEQAEEGLECAYNRWEERTGRQHQAWEDQQIAEHEAKLRNDPTVDQSRVGDIIRIEAAARLAEEKAVALEQEQGMVSVPEISANVS